MPRHDRTDRGLSFVSHPGDSVTANTIVGSGAGMSLQFNPGRVDPNNSVFSSSRKPLAGQFSFAGQTFFVIVNHFTSENPLLRFVEKRLAPLASKIGFHADFPLDDFLAASELDVRESRPSNLFGYWRLLRCLNEKPHNEC